MKLIIDRADMLGSMLLAEKSSSGSTAVDDAYTHVLLRSAAGEVWLEATNGISWLRSRVEAEAEGEFEIMLKSAAFSDLVKALPEGQAEFSFSSHEGGRMSVRAGAFTGWFPYRGGLDFPQVKHFADGGVRIPGAAFKAAMKRVEFAEGKEPGRPTLHGIRLDLASGSLTLSAINGAQLAAAWTEIGDCEKAGWTIKSDFASKLVKMAAMGDLVFSGNKTSLTARVRDVMMTSRVYDHPFPDWRNGGGVPKETDRGTKRRVNRLDLLGAVERAVSVNSRAKRIPAVVLEGRDDEIIVSCNLDGYGSTEPVKAVIGGTRFENDCRSVNGIALIRTLENSSAEEVRLVMYEKPNIALDIFDESKKPAITTRNLIMPYYI